MGFKLVEKVLKIYSSLCYGVGKKNFKMTQIQKDAFPCSFTCEWAR